LKICIVLKIGDAIEISEKGHMLFSAGLIGAKKRERKKIKKN
jgi:hypothetical protein